MKVLLTGAAGFIGASLAQRLLTYEQDIQLLGLDSLNDYYSPELKEYRLCQVEKLSHKHPGQWRFVRGNIADKNLVENIFSDFEPEIVINLAAQAGVRYSITNPDSYIESNIIGFYNILEACRHSYDYGRSGVKHLVYASSSSVYGSNTKVPYSTGDKVDQPVSLYAATKKSNELLAHSYSKLYNIPSTGLRFFTVYGPAGRPDMAYFSFTQKLLSGQSIKLYNYGECLRDFTYIDDIVEALSRIIYKAPERCIGTDGLPLAPYKIYNIGNSQPEKLQDFVNILSCELQLAGLLPDNFELASHCEYAPMQAGDVIATYADTSELERDFGFRPHTPLREGLRRFIQWYINWNNK